MSTDRLGGRKTLEVEGFLEELEKEEIKRGVDIVGLLGSFGVELERKGKGYTGRCPWHEDSTPSLSVDREKGLYHCFGCGESGDTVSLVEKVKGVGFREALRYLKNGGVRLSTEGRVPDTPAPRAAAESEQRFVLDDVAEHYARLLAGTEEARAYLRGRGLDRPELEKRFRLGYSDGKLAGLLGAVSRLTVNGQDSSRKTGLHVR